MTVHLFVVLEPFEFCVPSIVICIQRKIDRYQEGNMTIADVNHVIVKYVLLFADPIPELEIFVVCFIYKRVTMLGFVLLELCKHCHPFFLRRNDFSW